LKNTQRRRDFKGGVAFGVAKNFCSGLALILIICCYWPPEGGKFVLGTLKAGGNVRGRTCPGGNVRLPAGLRQGKQSAERSCSKAYNSV